MIKLSEREIDEALSRASNGLTKYLWIEDKVRRCDVRRDVSFQTRYKGFYRVRRDAAWCGPYFELMQEAKTTGITFSKALHALAEYSGRCDVKPPLPANWSPP